MKRIRYMSFTMDFPLQPYEVGKFRGAVINAMDDAPDLFHQHKESGVIYRYPLIQYKIINRRPTIICLEEGVDTIHHFFQNRKETLKIGHQEYVTDISKMNLKSHLLQVWDRQFSYTINNWLPLNADNYPQFKALDTVVEKTQFLEKILRNNIVQLAIELDWDVASEIVVAFRKVYPAKSVTYKEMHYKSYKVDFYTNVTLPNYIGLGKASSTGFGVVSQNSERN